MHTTFDSASLRITMAQAEKEKYRHKWESNCMYTEDLEATNARWAVHNLQCLVSFTDAAAKMKTWMTLVIGGPLFTT